jgi:uncharacterized protein YfdQ (DUF2303 family)
MSDEPRNSDTHDAVQAGRNATTLDLRIDDYEGIPVGISTAGHVHVLADVLEQMDRRADAPRRRMGTAKMTELDSFIAHVNRAKQPESTVFADGTALTAVYNYYPGNTRGVTYDGAPLAAWADHRAVYSCPLSEEWQAWTNHNNVELSQDRLASFLEDRSADIFDCDECKRIDIIGLTHDLQIYTKGVCKKQVDRTTGAHTLLNSEEHGEGSTKIPPLFKLRIPVFVGGELYEIFARLQLRIKDGRPVFTYRLQRSAEVKRQAFYEILTSVADATGLPVFAGTPEA